ncbi:TetR-like C-terminal domain-containing protein [Frankia gtarii]|uniref:TetR-like C-terminal domain-containing protein n=1 Tax=Frankia gtarii TaxID=2950102 RepID=UPI0021BE9A7A|nr:TetR-like C-terminal domain-containing protein [Frankia gtarii]
MIPFVTETCREREVDHGTELDAERFDRGGLATDLSALVEHVVALLSTPVGRHALPGLAADLQADPEVRHSFRTRFVAAEVELVAGMLARARSRAELRPDCAISAHGVHAHLLGMAWAEVFLVGGEPDA